MTIYLPYIMFDVISTDKTAVSTGPSFRGVIVFGECDHWNMSTARRGETGHGLRDTVTPSWW